MHVVGAAPGGSVAHTERPRNPSQQRFGRGGVCEGGGGGLGKKNFLGQFRSAKPLKFGKFQKFRKSYKPLGFSVNW